MSSTQIYLFFFPERSAGSFHLNSWTTTWKGKAMGTWEPLIAPAQLESSLASYVPQTLYLFVVAVALQVQARTAHPAVLILAHQREELTSWEPSAILEDWKLSHEDLEGRGKFVTACCQTFPGAPQVNEMLRGRVWFSRHPSAKSTYIAVLAGIWVCRHRQLSLPQHGCSWTSLASIRSIPIRSVDPPERSGVSLQNK